MLDIILGNGDNVFSAGELNRFPKRNGLPQNLFEESPSYVFWKDFRDKFEVLRGEPFDFDTLQKLTHRFEYHSGFFRILFNSNNRRLHRSYCEYINGFFENLFDKVEEEVIIDSSKYPSRALMLSRCLKYEVKYIYIKRDPVSTVISFAKKGIEQPSKSWLSANVYYFAVNFICSLAERTLRKRHRIITIKYEDLLEKPYIVLENIQKKLQIDLSSASYRISNGEGLKVGKLFDGNRIRLEDSIKVESNAEKNPDSFKNMMTAAFNYMWWH